jgi:hypothetical protein
MGCKQTTTKSPSIVFAISPTSTTSPTTETSQTTTPVYVKSALKKSRVSGKGKTEKLSFLKQKPSILSKSVNFDENVEVKLRTPTPKESRYEKITGTKQTPNDDDDFDGDDQLSSISSQDDIHNEQIKTSTISSNQSLQRNQSNGFWHKTNSVAAIPLTNNINEKSQQPSLNLSTYSTENVTIPTGTRFRVRRKVQYSASLQASNRVDPNQTSAIPFQRSTVQQFSTPVQRTLPNTNAILIKHHESFPNARSLPQAAYYAFSRRPTDKTTSTDK